MITFSCWIESSIEMVKGRNDELFVAFVDMEKPYDRVNNKKLLRVMRCYGVHNNFVGLIKIIYDGCMVKFELENIIT